MNYTDFSEDERKFYAKTILHERAKMESSVHSS